MILPCSQYKNYWGHHVLSFHTKSSTSSVCFTLSAPLYRDEPHAKCSVTTRASGSHAGRHEWGCCFWWEECLVLMCMDSWMVLLKEFWVLHWTFHTATLPPEDWHISGTTLWRSTAPFLVLGAYDLNETKRTHTLENAKSHCVQLNTGVLPTHRIHIQLRDAPCPFLSQSTWCFDPECTPSSSLRCQLYTSLRMLSLCIPCPWFHHVSWYRFSKFPAVSLQTWWGFAMLQVCGYVCVSPLEAEYSKEPGTTPQ